MTASGLLADGGDDLPPLAQGTSLPGGEVDVDARVRHSAAFPAGRRRLDRCHPTVAAVPRGTEPVPLGGAAAHR